MTVSIMESKHGPAKQQLTIRPNADVLAWLKANGRGHRTRINRILRSAMESQTRRARAEFEKNLQGITSIMAALPPGAKVTVIGTTEDSFAAPYIILSGKLAGDEGYFKERLANGRATLTRAWQARSAQLAPRCAETDILGALFVASEVFRESSGDRRKVLVVFSDIKQATSALNVEHQPVVQIPAALQQVKNNKLFADLQGVDVYAEGVDGAGESVGYWQSLHEFWMAYFVRVGATLVGYSALRGLPEFELSSPTMADSRER